MSFATRMGIEENTIPLRKDEISYDLRVTIWNLFYRFIFCDRDFVKSITKVSLQDYFEKLTFHFWKEALDELPTDSTAQIGYIRDKYFSYDWIKFYSFLEYSIQVLQDVFPQLEPSLNISLKKERAPFRSINGEYYLLTDDQEIDELETVLNDDSFKEVNIHIKAASRMYSDRENPDYRNSIKESISAVECMAHIITGNPDATLGDALKNLKKIKHLHPSLATGFSNLYGYTSNGDGIRHALKDTDNELQPEDAKFFLMICISFINYLKAKMQ